MIKETKNPRAKASKNKKAAIAKTTKGKESIKKKENKKAKKKTSKRINWRSAKNSEVRPKRLWAGPGETYNDALESYKTGVANRLSESGKKTFFGFEAHDIDGKLVKISDLCKGKKATLVVNVASK